MYVYIYIYCIYMYCIYIYIYIYHNRPLLTPYQRLNPLPDFHEIRHGVLHKKLSSRREFHETRRSDSGTLLRGVNESVRILPKFLQLFG